MMWSLLDRFCWNWCGELVFQLRMLLHELDEDPFDLPDVNSLFELDDAWSIRSVENLSGVLSSQPLT